jgi:hypothetical protein
MSQGGSFRDDVSCRSGGRASRSVANSGARSAATKRQSKKASGGSSVSIANDFAFGYFWPVSTW